MLLKKLIEEKKVALFAMIHKKFKGGDGLEKFTQDLLDRCVEVPLIQGQHYTINHDDAPEKEQVATNGYGAYSAEVWIKGPITLELIAEISDLLAEKNSHPRLNADGDLHTWNAPLYRLCAELGALDEDCFVSAKEFRAADPSVDNAWILEVIRTAKMKIRTAKIAEQKAVLANAPKAVKTSKIKTVLRRGVECCPCGINVKYCDKCNPTTQAAIKAAIKESSKTVAKVKATIRRHEFALAELAHIPSPAAASDAASA